MRILNLIFIAAIFLATQPACAQLKSLTAPAMGDTAQQVERDFVQGPFGQVHVRIARPKTASTNPPLVLFHPTPYSSDYFASFIKQMATDRIVIAIDTPGYGDSDSPPEPQSISAYANSAATVLKTLGYGAEGNGAVDVLGYHTGCLIATELAVMRPDMVRRLVLPGVPFYTGEARQEAYKENAKPDILKVDGSHLDSKWEFATSAMGAGLTLERAQEHFSDGMQCHPDCWWAYHGVFTYPSEEQFKKVTQPVLLITIAGSLKEETEQAVPYFSDVELIHIPEITRGGFDLESEKIADVTRAFLDR